eukprot:3198314-Prymnesium_polylepis.2
MAPPRAPGAGPRRPLFSVYDFRGHPFPWGRPPSSNKQSKMVELEILNIFILYHGANGATHGAVDTTRTSGGRCSSQRSTP